MSEKRYDVIEMFASDVFDDATMKHRLPKKIYAEFKNTLMEGKDLEPHVAEIIAHEMKEWAIDKGATHYTHWFQPLTGITAEKHDAFINPQDDGTVLMSLSGKELLKGESDGSSFPSGGIRATFEARGYTAWDCTSPAFIREYPDGSAVLCIPTVFCSYTGEALDKKTPLLRSMEAISTQALRIVRLFGDTQTTKIITNVGAEQEYFLLDRSTYNQRKDLIFTGRTLFGAQPPKGQELDDHYFGTIKERVLAFMTELNEELWKLGIPAKTQHNEAAPGQKELAPVFNTANIAADHNQLIMEIMKKVALRHDLVCLLHEKPFAGINGSGKHNNWSLSTDTGMNLLDPGKDPHSNKQFLLILAAVLKAVDEYAPLLRMSAALPGNDHRLGGNEAPPAIISVFLGEQLYDILLQLCETGDATYSIKGSKLETGVSTVPTFRMDATDRNRTSPFAFTGNKFEFRMVGSSASISDPNTVLNTIVADSLKQAADILENAQDFDAALQDLMKEWVSAHMRIIFNGDGYSDEWVEEAARRGLPNIDNTVDAFAAMSDLKFVKLFERHGVLTPVEITAREEVGYDNYSKAINIESRTMVDMVKKQILPAVIHYTKDIAEDIQVLHNVGADASVQERLLSRITEELKSLTQATRELEEATNTAVSVSGAKEQAVAFRDEVFSRFSSVRNPADELEKLVDQNVWPFPTYADLLFNV